MPSFLYVLPMASKAFLYTFAVPAFASSPCSCKRVFATSAGFEICQSLVSRKMRPLIITNSDLEESQPKVCDRCKLPTAIHAAIPPHMKPSAVEMGRPLTGAGEAILREVEARRKNGSASVGHNPDDRSLNQ
jgi:hypothetical protein